MMESYKLKQNEFVNKSQIIEQIIEHNVMELFRHAKRNNYLTQFYQTLVKVDKNDSSTTYDYICNIIDDYFKCTRCIK